MHNNLLFRHELHLFFHANVETTIFLSSISHSDFRRKNSPHSGGPFSKITVKKLSLCYDTLSCGKFVIFSFESQEFFVGSSLDNVTIFHDHDAVRVLDRG
jgi:hypothetical protein